MGKKGVFGKTLRVLVPEALQSCIRACPWIGFRSWRTGPRSWIAPLGCLPLIASCCFFIELPTGFCEWCHEHPPPHPEALEWSFWEPEPFAYCVFWKRFIKKCWVRCSMTYWNLEGLKWTRARHIIGRVIVAVFFPEKKHWMNCNNNFWKESENESTLTFLVINSGLWTFLLFFFCRLLVLQLCQERIVFKSIFFLLRSAKVMTMKMKLNPSN